MDKEIDYWIKDGDIGYQREVDSCDNCETDLAITIKTYSPGVVCDGCMGESE